MSKSYPVLPRKEYGRLRRRVHDAPALWHISAEHQWHHLPTPPNETYHLAARLAHLPNLRRTKLFPTPIRPMILPHAPGAAAGCVALTPAPECQSPPLEWATRPTFTCLLFFSISFPSLSCRVPPQVHSRTTSYRALGLAGTRGEHERDDEDRQYPDDLQCISDPIRDS